MLTQEDFHGTFQKLLERYKCIAAGGDVCEGVKSFMCILLIKVPKRKKSGNLFNDPPTFLLPSEHQRQKKKKEKKKREVIEGLKALRISTPKFLNKEFDFIENSPAQL